MAGELKIEVNDVVHSVDASPETPLLYVLRNELHRRAPRGHCRHREVRGIRGTREGVAHCAEPSVRAAKTAGGQRDLTTPTGSPRAR